MNKPYLQESLHVQHYRSLSTTEDLDFYISKLQSFADTSCSILELACGDGRIIEILLPLNINITGLDSSKAMLSRCKPHKNLQLLEGDMRSFNLGTQFDCIILGFRTFHMLLTEKDQASCLQAVSKHLKPTGSFYLHLMHVDASKLTKGASPKVVKLTNGELTRRTIDHNLDMANQVYQSTVEYRLQVATKPDIVELETLHWRWLWPEQLQQLLEKADLKIESYTTLQEDRMYHIKKT